MVGLILAFIFLTPRAMFRDQPRVRSVVMLPSERGAHVYWIEPELLEGVSDADLVVRAGALVKARYANRPLPVRVERIYNSEEEIKGYMAFAQP